VLDALSRHVNAGWKVVACWRLFHATRCITRPKEFTTIAPELIFLLSTIAVVGAGIRLSRDGDSIAGMTGLGGAWIGAILVAGATSLPELVTDIAAVRNSNVGLAMGDLFGSTMANMVILAGADLATIRHRLLTRVAINQLLVGATAISLTAIIVAGIVSGESATVLGVGWAPLAAFASYVAAMRILHVNRGVSILEGTPHPAIPDQRQRMLRRSVFGFVVGTVVILLTARFLAGSSAETAEKYGLSQGFVGVALLAVTTSLPELTVTIESVRRGSFDLAVGNLLGSCAFNMAIPFSSTLPMDRSRCSSASRLR
jgi:cation:H+ antiporter